MKTFRATPRSAHSWPNPVPGEAPSCERCRNWKPTGFITRRSQFHDSGAQGSTPYYLNHPQAPHPAPRSDLGRGVPNRDPLNPPLEPPTEPAADATRVLAALPEPWRVGRKDAEILIPAIEAALASGWTLETLIPHISQNPDGVRSPARVLARRLADLPHRAPALLPANHRVVRRMRRRTITHHHHRHARRHRSSCVLPPLQPASATKGTRLISIREGDEINWKTTSLTNSHYC